MLSARRLVRAASFLWRHAPTRVVDAGLYRTQQALAALHGYGLESLESEVIAACSELPARPCIVFDVGAHRGDWSRGVRARRASAGDRFFLFEPSAVNLRALERLAVPEFTVVPMAVSDGSGHAPLFADAAGSGLGSLHQRDLRSDGVIHEKQEEVATITLDDFAETNGIGRIDFLKLDIEGHELAALRGATRLLGETRIGALAFEFGGTQVDARAFLRDYWNLLASHEYQLHRVMPGGLLLPMPRYSVALEVFRFTTYLALAPRR